MFLSKFSRHVNDHFHRQEPDIEATWIKDIDLPLFVEIHVT